MNYSRHCFELLIRHPPHKKAQSFNPLHAIFRRTGSLIDLFSNFPSTHSTHKLQMSSTNTHHPVVSPAMQQSLAPGACNLCKRSVRGLVLRIGRTEPSRTSWVLTSLADSKRLGSPFVSQRQWKPEVCGLQCQSLFCFPYHGGLWRVQEYFYSPRTGWYSLLRKARFV